VGFAECKRFDKERNVFLVEKSKLSECDLESGGSVRRFFIAAYIETQGFSNTSEGDVYIFKCCFEAPYCTFTTLLEGIRMEIIKQ
jgi:hypothetical protein